MRSKDQELMRSIIDFINDYHLENYTTPTMQEIADKFNLAKSSASRYVAVMRENGMLEHTKGKSGMKTLSMNKFDNVSLAPVVGTVACGKPLLAEENVETYLPLPTSILGKGKFFILKAHGDSMKNAGINDGDYVIVRKQDSAEVGQIVVALIDDEATLKRYYLDNERQQVRLHPENDKYEDMYFDDIVIQGVAVKVIADVK